MTARSDTVEVVVKLAPEAMLADSQARLSVQACIGRLGISMEPLHGSTSDPELGPYFVAHVDQTAVEGVLAELLACEGVDAAYAKPPGEPP